MTGPWFTSSTSIAEHARLCRDAARRERAGEVLVERLGELGRSRAVHRGAPSLAAIGRECDLADDQRGAAVLEDRAVHAAFLVGEEAQRRDAFGEPLHTFPAFTASVCNLNPTSRGTVAIRSNRFEDAPAIAPNYLSTDEDRMVAAESLRVTRRIVSQPALAKYRPEEWKPGPQFQTDEELARLAGDIATTIFHPVGTTKMGRGDDPMAVVDSRLRVRGIAGLRVVDAGVMPTITSGNTNSPTLMIAEKAAHWIAQEAALRSQAAVAA